MPKSTINVEDNANYILQKVGLAIKLQKIKNPEFEEKSDLRTLHARAINVSLGLDNWKDYENEAIIEAKKELGIK